MSQRDAVKIAVLFDGYEPFHEAKEGNLLQGLQEAGGSVTLITLEKPNLRNYRSSVAMLQASWDQLEDRDYWAALNVKVVIVYSYLHWRYNDIARAIRRAGKKVIFRADSDGCIGDPVPSRRLQFGEPGDPLGFKNRARRIAWKVAGKAMASRRIGHLEIADAVFIETPIALQNLTRFLGHWGREDLVAKVRVIPMAISHTATQGPVSGFRQKRVIAVGRWDDRHQKNTGAAVRVLARFLEATPDYEAMMIGPGETTIRILAGSSLHRTNGRLLLPGALPQRDVIAHMAKAQVLFMPSNWEGFALAAGEASCQGCTVVGSPLAILEYLSRNGEFGTLASGFDEEALFHALQSDVARWGRSEYDPLKIADQWRKEINRERVGEELIALAREISADAPLRYLCE